MRSAIVALIVAIGLVAGWAFVLHRQWPILEARLYFGTGILMFGPIYAALVFALLVRCVANPKRPMPLLLFPLAIVMFVMEMTRGAQDQTGYTVEESTPEEPSLKAPLGRAWAIVLMVVFLGFYGLSLGWMLYPDA